MQLAQNTSIQKRHIIYLMFRRNPPCFRGLFGGGHTAHAQEQVARHVC